LPAGVTPTVSIGGTATQGADYTYSITQTGIQISADADGLYDPNETVIITLTAVSGNAGLGTIKTHTVTLTEPPLVVEFTAASSSLGESNAGTVSYNMTLPAGVTPTISLGGTATQGSDYTYSISQTGISITTTADGLYDPNETIIITLTSVSGNALLGTTKTHTVTLTEPPLVVEFTTASSSLGEGSANSVAYNMTLPAGVTPTISLGGTATQGSDYTYSITQNGIVITAAADGLYDPNETIIITMTAVSGNATLGTVKTHTVTLTEPPLSVEFFSASSTVSEGGGKTVTYNMTLPAGVTPTISLSGTATPSSDFTYIIAQNGILITTLADGLYDPNETIAITLTGVSGNAVLGTTITHTLTIDEAPLLVEFEVASSSLGEGGSNSVAYSMALPAGVTPTISLGGTASLDTDYTYSITQTGIQITANADGLYDPNETVILTLTGVSGNAVLGALKTHTATLTEPPLVVEFTTASSSLGESNAGTISYNMTLPAGVTPTVSLGGTATLDSDYTYSISQTGISITPVADGLYDPNETIIITLTSVSGNAVLGTIKTHTLTLTEPPLVVNFAAASSSMSEGSANSVSYNMTLPVGVTPTISLGGTATQGPDYTYSITQNGIVITTAADGLYDPNETIVIILTGVSGNAVLGTAITHTITLTEPPLTIEFAASTSTVQEGQNGTASFRFTLPAGVSPIVSLGGIAIQGTDYTYSITPGGLVFTVLEEWLSDPDETVIITLTGVIGNAELGTAITHTLSITDPPGQVVEFATPSSTMNEGQSITVLYSAPLPVGVSPTLSFGGTASQGIDYTYALTSEGIIINAIGDGLFDTDETISLTLTGFNNNAAEFGATLTHAIALTDVAFIVEFATGSSTLIEGSGGTAAFTIPLPADVNPTISFGGTATEGVDYTHTLTPAGIAINVVDEWAFDPDETILVTLTGVSGNVQLGSLVTHTVTLTDPPSQVIEFATASSTVTEGQAITVLFNTPLPSGVVPTITLDGTAAEESDYFYSITPTGIVISADGDGQFDADETILVTLTGFNTNGGELGTLITHTVTIADTPMVIEFQAVSSRRVEGTAVVAAFSQQLPAGVTPIFSIGGSATTGPDYTYSQNQNGFVLTTKKDEIYDPEETVTVQVTGFTGNVTLGPKTTYTLTIEDEDEKATPRLQINLSWNSGNGTPGNVDMDLIVWYESSPGVFTMRFLSDNGGQTFESVSIPSNLENGKWGVSYVYYSGTSNNVNYTVNFRSYKGNLDGISNRAIYNATYTLVNINKWDQTQAFKIEQFYEKSANNYINFTGVTVPGSGSRMRLPEFIIDRSIIKSNKLPLGSNLKSKLQD
jgi:hypothetical protein